MSLTKFLRAVVLAAATTAALAPTAVVFAQPASEPAPAATTTPAEAPAAPAITPAVANEVVDNPYGLGALWAQGDFVAKGTLIIMVIMSMGSWYIIFTKLFEQQKLLNAANAAGKT